MMTELKKPIFFIGVPRSGTTVLFEAFSQHNDLAWITNYTRMFPRYPSINALRQVFDNRYIRIVGKKNQYGEKGILNRFFPRPDEGYEFWDMYSNKEFSKSYLHNRTATTSEIERLQSATCKLLKWQKRNRFAAKLTGPGRISYLSSVYPDAYFIHVIRDGMSVAHSLLNVGFWKNGGGLKKPWWQPGLSHENHSIWESSNFDSATLAAIQWKQIIEYSRLESKTLRPGKYIEVRYEDFVASPRTIIAELFRKVELTTSEQSLEYTNKIKPQKQMNSKYKSFWGAEHQAKIIESLAPLYNELGYGN